MVAKCTGIIPIIPDLVSASGMKIGAVYKRVYGFTDLRGKPAGRKGCMRITESSYRRSIESLSRQNFLVPWISCVLEFSTQNLNK